MSQEKIPVRGAAVLKYEIESPQSVPLTRATFIHNMLWARERNRNRHEISEDDVVDLDRVYSKLLEVVKESGDEQTK